MTTKLNFSLFILFFLLTIVTPSVFAEDVNKINRNNRTNEIATPQGTTQTNSDQRGTSGVDAGATVKSVASANIIIAQKTANKIKNDKKTNKQNIKPAKKITPKKNHNGAKAIPFADNEQIKVFLSNRNINRIVVTRDKIKTIHGPTGLYTAKNDPSDPSGSAYISIYSNTSFTIFLATTKGRNFSLLITPKTAPGITITLEPTTPTLLTNSPTETDSYQKTLIDLISNMINLEPSEDYAYVSASEAKKHKWINNIKRNNFYNSAYIKPIAFYRGENLLGIVSSIKNRTRNPLTLKPACFYQPGVKAIALSQQIIPPLGSCWLYQIVNQN